MSLGDKVSSCMRHTQLAQGALCQVCLLRYCWSQVLVHQHQLSKRVRSNSSIHARGEGRIGSRGTEGSLRICQLQIVGKIGCRRDGREEVRDSFKRAWIGTQKECWCTAAVLDWRATLSVRRGSSRAGALSQPQSRWWGLSS